MTGLAGAAAGVLMLASAVITAALAATLQIGASRLRTLRSEGFAGAEALAQLRGIEVTVRASVRLVTRFCNLTALGIVTVLGVERWPAAWAAILVVLSGIALVHVVTDILPHALAARSPVRLALSSAPLLLGLVRLTRPLTAPVAVLEDRIAGGNDDETTEQRELREIREIGEEAGILEESENRLVERAFRLDELTAWDVMVPRVDIFAWKDDTKIDEIIGSLSEVRFSRVPVYRGSVDEITGIVYVREAYERFVQGGGSGTLAELARPPFFVPGSLSLTQLLQDFQARRIHMGIVADEFGGTDGLVTLEDVLEELVGEIHDELDLEEVELVRVSPTTLECDAGIDLRELNEALGVELPKAEHRSLNGYILEELGHVPVAGAVLERTGLRIEILEATDTQVIRARLSKLQHASGEAP
ncbi:MAG TPA: hemolysin family protein [Longimicrobiales bacterium]|nr:hemolysin family protein [Longimicrobiales bacterium]